MNICSNDTEIDESLVMCLNCTPAHKTTWVGLSYGKCEYCGRAPATVEHMKSCAVYRARLMEYWMNQL